MLRRFVGVIRPHTQRKLAEYLASLTEDFPTWPRMNLLGLPSVRALLPELAAPGLQPLSTAAVLIERAIFITSPLERRKKKDTEVVWVVGEPVEVRVWLTNTMAFEVPVNGIALLTEGAPFAAAASRLVLPPSAAPVELVLHGRPHAAGTVHIRGCLERAFNLECEHLVRADGRAMHAYVPPSPLQMPSMY